MLIQKSGKFFCTLISHETVIEYYSYIVFEWFKLR